MLTVVIRSESYAIIRNNPWNQNSLWGKHQQFQEFFMLKYHGGWSFTEVYNLPVQIRRWFLERLIKQKEDEKKAIEEQINKNNQVSSDWG